MGNHGQRILISIPESERTGFLEVTRLVQETTGSLICLLAAGFAIDVAVCIQKLRQERVSLTLVGNVSGVIEGQGNIRFQPERSLHNLKELPAGSILLFPSGSPCQQVLLADPRVYRLIQQLLAAGGLLATLGDEHDVEPLLTLVQNGPYWAQGGQTAAEFAVRLAGWRSEHHQAPAPS